MSRRPWLLDSSTANFAIRISQSIHRLAAYVLFRVEPTTRMQAHWWAWRWRRFAMELLAGCSLEFGNVRLQVAQISDVG